MKHLPTMEAAQRSQVIRVPKLLSDAEIASVHALHSSMSAKLGHASARARVGYTVAHNTA